MPSHSFSLPSTSLDYRREPILPANVANVVQLRLPHSTLCCIKRCALCFVYSTFRYKTMCYLKPPFCERTLPARLAPHPVPRSLLFLGGGETTAFLPPPPPTIHHFHWLLCVWEVKQQFTICFKFHIYWARESTVYRKVSEKLSTGLNLIDWFWRSADILYQCRPYSQEYERQSVRREKSEKATSFKKTIPISYPSPRAEMQSWATNPESFQGRLKTQVNSSHCLVRNGKDWTKF